MQEFKHVVLEGIEFESHGKVNVWFFLTSHYMKLQN